MICNFLKNKIFVLKFYLQLVKCPIDDKPVSFQLMALYQPCNKPLFQVTDDEIWTKFDNMQYVE